MRRGRETPPYPLCNKHLQALRRKAHENKVFADTDTALIEFSNESIAETKEISENLYIDLDGKGNLVSMTIEHAKEKAGISEISFLQMEKAG